MKALVYYGHGELRLDDRPVPTPGKDEVLIKMRAVSICGSDLGAYRLLEDSPRWEPPIVLGHEFAGEIAGFGEDVHNFTIGQAVTANPMLYCGKCYYCKNGQFNLCPHRFSLGTSIGGLRHDGAMQEYLAVRASNVFLLPEGVSFIQGALAEPLAVTLAAAKNGDWGDGERVLIIGMGPIGQMILKFLKAQGHKQVFVSDVLPMRLRLAEEIGADALINGKEDVVAKVSQLTDGIGVDRVIIAAGFPGVIESSIKMVRNGGRIVVVALMHHHVDLNPLDIVGRQISIIGSYMFTHEFSEVLDMIAAKKINVDDLITSTHPLASGLYLFDELCDVNCKDLKVILTNE
jgi:threonine dehydrogenase-like Zn-dependent dehydrogenase